MISTITVYVYERPDGRQVSAKITIYMGSQMSEPVYDTWTNALWYSQAQRGYLYTVRVRRGYSAVSDTYNFDQWQSVTAPATVRFYLSGAPPATEPELPPEEPPPTPPPPEPHLPAPIGAGTCCIISALAIPILALLAYLSTLL